MPLAIKIKQGKIVTYIKIWWKEITMTHKKEKNKWKKSEKDTTNCQILWHTFLQSFQNLVNHINSHFIRMLLLPNPSYVPKPNKFPSISPTTPKSKLNSIFKLNIIPKNAIINFLYSFLCIFYINFTHFTFKHTPFISHSNRIPNMQTRPLQRTLRRCQRRLWKQPRPKSMLSGTRGLALHSSRTKSIRDFSSTIGKFSWSSDDAGWFSEVC